MEHAATPRFRERVLGEYFVNDRESLVKVIGAQSWIGDHVHDRNDIMVGGTLCIGIPGGIPARCPRLIDWTVCRRLACVL